MKIIEATLIMPMTCLIAAGLITLMMWMYNQFMIQIDEHAAERESIYTTREVVSIRVYDKIYEEFTE